MWPTFINKQHVIFLLHTKLNYTVEELSKVFNISNIECLTLLRDCKKLSKLDEQCSYYWAMLWVMRSDQSFDWFNSEVYLYFYDVLAKVDWSKSFEDICYDAFEDYVHVCEQYLEIKKQTASKLL